LTYLFACTGRLAALADAIERSQMANRECKDSMTGAVTNEKTAWEGKQRPRRINLA
jgi:hypothetical protein